jgi:hypothetical protein
MKGYMIKGGLKVGIFIDEPVNESIHGLVGGIMSNSVTHLAVDLMERLLD